MQRTSQFPSPKHRSYPRMGRLVLSLAAGFAWITVSGAQEPAQESTGDVQWNTVVQFVSEKCLDCHRGADAEGGLDLDQHTTGQTPQLSSETNFDQWVRLFDRVRLREMPPESDLDDDELRPMLDSLAGLLQAADREVVADQGRAVWRRMNRYEYENTLRDLFDAPWLQIKTILPEDGESHLFNKVGRSLDTSHVQISRYLQAAQYALEQVIVGQQDRPEPKIQRFYARLQPAMGRRLRFNNFNRSPERAVFPLLDHEADLEVLFDEQSRPSRADQDPSRLEKEAVGVVASSYEPIELRFNEFEAAAPGRYKLRFRAYTFWAGPGEEQRWWRPDRSVASVGRTQEPVTIYSESPPRLLRWLGAFDVFPEPSVQEIEVELLAGETIRPDAARLFRSRPSNYHNPLAERDGSPGVAFYWMEVEGPLHDQWPPSGHRLLFDDLEVVEAAPSSAHAIPIELVSQQPRVDARRLLERFMARAYRRPVDPNDVDGLYQVVEQALDTGGSLLEALLAGYSAVLCSPEFVSLREEPGRLDDYAIASRLSYLLWNSEPDSQLRQLAASGELHDLETLQAQVDRLIDSPKVNRFVEAFLAYWLDLRHLNATSPDEFLYNDYYLDDLLVESAERETQRYFLELIRENLSASHVIDSDFVFVNQSLAEHYQLTEPMGQRPEIKGVELQRVSLPADSPRGGIMTQASVLKVTADGTNTSPVKRGAWVMERLLGQKPPPPPPGVPGLQPDTRGAKTIRDQLALHRETESCNRCHRHIDPVGFALESFDVLGGWRDRYRTLNQDRGEGVEGYGKNGQPLKYHLDLPVDSSGEMADGRSFHDIRELKAMLLEDRRLIARNLVHQLVTYATGAPPRFSDRAKVEHILDLTRVDDEHGRDNYPVRSLIHQIVASPLFTMK